MLRSFGELTLCRSMNEVRGFFSLPGSLQRLLLCVYPHAGKTTAVSCWASLLWHTWRAQGQQHSRQQPGIACTSQPGY